MSYHLIATLHSPLYVELPRKTKKNKRIYLNINWYRNGPYFELNAVKKTYKEYMQKQIKTLPTLNKIACRFVLYPKTNRLCDLPNICSIHDKFFMDALVEYGIIADDNYTIHIASTSSFGSVCKNNPRVDIEIYQVKD